jgi:FkbM family methyltransferase
VSALWKPWFVYRPRQLARRVGQMFAAPPTGMTAVTLPWGATLTVNPGETVGRAIWTTGVYDIAVSEVLFRLVPFGGRAIDAGANVGYMTSLLAAKAGPPGRVESFEPHPVLGQRLRDNVRHAASAVELHALALSDAAGVARFVLPAGFSANEGIGHLAPANRPATPDETAIEVPTATLDGLFPDDRFDVLKLDVEGHEAAVLRGARGLLGRGAVRHVVFEDHAIATSAAAEILHAAGYALFQVGWAMRGPVVAGLVAPRLCKPYEAPSYLATLDPTGATAALAPRGWRIYG